MCLHCDLWGLQRRGTSRPCPEGPVAWGALPLLPVTWQEFGVEMPLGANPEQMRGAMYNANPAPRRRCQRRQCRAVRPCAPMQSPHYCVGKHTTHKNNIRNLKTNSIRV